MKGCDILNWLFILCFALSSSFDNLGVGITYGIRKIRINLIANIVIAFICFILSYFGIVFGRLISDIIPGRIPLVISAVFLLAIGLRFIWISLPFKQNVKEEFTEMKGLKSILQNPECVDFNKSKDIQILEAIVLGIALSVNALTNGLSAGLLEYSPFAISLASAIGSYIALWFGIKIGQSFADIQIGPFKLGEFGTLISGVLLVIIAIKIII